MNGIEPGRIGEVIGVCEYQHNTFEEKVKAMQELLEEACRQALAAKLPCGHPVACWKLKSTGMPGRGEMSGRCASCADLLRVAGERKALERVRSLTEDYVAHNPGDWQEINDALVAKAKERT